MLKKGFLKPEISIKKIGKGKFWTGIIIGVLFAFVLSYFFNYSREALRTLTFITDNDPYILTDKKFRLYDLFFAAFATSLGFGFTIVYWLRGGNPYIRKRYLKTFAISNSWLITFVALMIVARFGSILPIILYGHRATEGLLDFIDDFWLLLVLIPIYVFFAHWNTIRMIFKARKWVLVSIVFYAITTFYLYKTTNVDRDILNEIYNVRNKERFEYIDAEFDKARKLGVVFSDSTKQVLRKKYAESTINLVADLKQAFHANNIVPLDTLILEKIVVHNLNRFAMYYLPTEQEVNWPYALPENIYCQIMNYGIHSTETKVLFEILAEQASIFAAPDYNWREMRDYPVYDKEKMWYRRNLLRNTTTIQSRLLQVVDKLKADKRYEKYHHLIPDFEFSDHRGWQEHYQLDIENCTPLE